MKQYKLSKHSLLSLHTWPVACPGVMRKQGKEGGVEVDGGGVGKQEYRYLMWDVYVQCSKSYKVCTVHTIWYSYIFMWEMYHISRYLQERINETCWNVACNWIFNFQVLCLYFKISIQKSTFPIVPSQSHNNKRKNINILIISILFYT